MAYKPPVQSIVDNETSSLPSSEAVFEALKDKADVDLQNLSISGSNGDVLTLSSGVPVWSAPSGGGGGSLPSQTGNSGKFLTTDGSAAAWELVDYADVQSPPINSLGVMQTDFVEKVVALSDAATIALDASQGNIFTVTITANRMIGNPTNPTSGQKIIVRVTQDGTGGRVLSFDSAWNLGQDLYGISNSTTANAVDYIGAIYNSVSSKWDVIAFVRGY